MSANPRGAGRPKGSRNKKTEQQAAAVVASGKTPLEYLTSVYQDDNESLHSRIDAAKAAAPYVHAKLSSIELNAAVTEMTHEQWLSALK